MFQPEPCDPRTQGYLWFLEYVKVEWGAEPSIIRLLSCGTFFQFLSGGRTPSLLLRVGLKLSFLIKLIVRPSYAAIGLDCRGISHDALSLYLLFLSLSPVYIHVSLIHVTNSASSPESLCLVLYQPADRSWSMTSDEWCASVMTDHLTSGSCSWSTRCVYI